jgi:hypothetical protein
MKLHLTDEQYDPFKISEFKQQMDLKEKLKPAILEWLRREKEDSNPPGVNALAIWMAGLAQDYFLNSNVPKPQEKKPVNEACLFRPVIVMSCQSHEFLNESWIYLGLDTNSPRIVAAEIKDGLTRINYFLDAKRIPGYDYGD